MSASNPCQRTIANSSDFEQVAVYFHDPVISHLFAELLEARGIQVSMIWDIAELPENSKIITERCYFERLSAEERRNCLVVGDEGSLQDISALSLCQPLTEDKIDQALHALLRRPSAVA